MAKTVEIPDELHDALEARAAKEGLLLQTYVARALRTVAEDDQAREELMKRIRNRPVVDLGVGAAGEKTSEQEATEQLLAELQAIPPGSSSGEEWLAYVRRLPKANLPEGWSSAEIIRELRGPLPDDDPEFQRNILGRR